MPSQNQWILDLLKDLQKESFYGKVVFEIKDGDVVLVRREESIMPPSFADK